MSQYPSNSDHIRENGEYANKHVSGSVVKGQVQRREKNWFDSVREFFGLKECHTFRDYVSVVSDMTNRVYGAVDTLLGSRPVGSNGASVPGARIAYSNYYNNPAPQQNAQQRINASYSYNDLEFDMRADAEVVLYKMSELLQMYKAVSVGDLFDLAGVTSPNGYTDQKYGWTDIRGARVVPVHGKYRIVGLPLPTQL